MFSAVNLDPNDINKKTAANIDIEEDDYHSFGYYIMPKYKMSLECYMNDD